MNIKKTKNKKKLKFFGDESENTERFIFVEEIRDFEIMEDNDKKVYLEMQVYDSQKEEFRLEKIIMVFDSYQYSQLFLFLLDKIEVATKIRETLMSFSKMEQVDSVLKKTSK